MKETSEVGSDGASPLRNLKVLVSLISPSRRKESFALLLGILVGGGLETLSIALFLPALALMTQDNLAEKYAPFPSFVGEIENLPHEQLVLVGLATIVFAYVGKALFLSILTKRQSQFVYGVQADLSRRLLSNYLSQPYVFHLQRNSAQLIRNVIGQVSDIGVVVQQGLFLVAELLVLVGIMSVLLVIEPWGASFVVLIVSVTSWSIYRYTRKRLLRWGAEREYHESQRIQHVQQALGCVKELKLLGSEIELVRQYQVHNIGSARIGERQTILHALPRLWMELLAVVGLSGLVLFLIGQGQPKEALLPTVGVFAVAAFRLTPSINRILAAFQNVGFAQAAIMNLRGDLNTSHQVGEVKGFSKLNFQKSLSVSNISFTYPLSQGESLHNVCMNVECGSTVGIIGTSGSGKSTLVDIIMGLLTPNTGSVTVDSINIEKNLRGWQAQIGYVPQSVCLIDDSIRRNVALGVPVDEVDDEAVWRAIRAAQLEDMVVSSPNSLDSRVGERGISLSGGQRQRIGIARALYHDPSVLIFDESTSSLDTSTEQQLMKAIDELKIGKTIILISHRLKTLEKCDFVYKLEGGRIVSGGAALETLTSDTELQVPPHEKIEGQIDSLAKS
jgi:ATP-binding cassette, subfamily B, bacterial PglK